MTKNKVLLSGILMVSLTAIFFLLKKMCDVQPKTATATYILPPCKKADLPFDLHYFSNDSSCHIRMETGTHIRIAPNTFQRKDGAPVSGMVEFRVREFHHAADILRSGIPMSLAPGSESQLESAGMIEMRAFDNGDELEIRKGMNIGVSLAAFGPSDGYQLYYLQNDSGWLVQGGFTTEENQFKKVLRDSADKLASVLRQTDTTDSDDIIFDVSGNAEFAPYLSSLQYRSWKLKKILTQTDTDLLFRKDWDSISLSVENKRKNLYRMTLHSSGVFADEDEPSHPETITVIVSPVFSKDNSKHDRKAFEVELEEYHALLEKMKEEEKRLSLQADMLNSFSANKLGVYNCDRLLNTPDLQTLPMTFDFQNNIDARVNKIVVYAIYQDINSVISYSCHDHYEVKFSPKRKMKLVAVLPGGEVAEADSETISNAIMQNRKQLSIKTKRYNADIYFSGLDNLAIR